MARDQCSGLQYYSVNAKQRTESRIDADIRDWHAGYRWTAVSQVCIECL